MNRNAALIKMRETYKTGTAKDLKSQLILYSYFLTPEDREKVGLAVEKKQKSEELVQSACDILGGTVA